MFLKNVYFIITIIIFCSIISCGKKDDPVYQKIKQYRFEQDVKNSSQPSYNIKHPIWRIKC